MVEEEIARKQHLDKGTCGKDGREVEQSIDKKETEGLGRRGLLFFVVACHAVYPPRASYWSGLYRGD